MDLADMGAAIDAADEVLRVETLDRYASASDYDWVAAYLRGDPPPDPGPKQPWLDKLQARRDRDQPQQRLRVVNRPVSDYLRYAAEWGYVDNAIWGEEIRVVDEAHAPDTAAALRGLSDLWILDGQVLHMHYDGDAKFRHAYWATMPEQEIKIVCESFAWAIPFTDWWADNPDLHRHALTS